VYTFGSIRRQVAHQFFLLTGRGIHKILVSGVPNHGARRIHIVTAIFD